MSTKISEYTKQGEKFYKFQIYVGKRKATGTTIYVRKRGFRSYDDAKKAYDKVNEQIKKGAYQSKKEKHYKVSDLVNLWLHGYRNTVRESTYTSTLRILHNHILPDLGTTYLDKLTPAKCIEVVNKWSKVAPKSVGKFMCYTNIILNKGVEWQLMQSNPMKFVDCPKPASNEKKEFTDYYSKEELERFLKEAREHHCFKYYAYFRLLAYSGMRRGEALALTWADVNLIDNVITVNKTVAQVKNNKLTIDPPKTAAGNRKIAMDVMTMSVLKKWRGIQNRQLVKLNLYLSPSKQLVFPNRNNELEQPARVAEWNRNICKSGNLRHIKTHGFRHTHATLLLAAGARMKDIQKRLGHARITTTMDTYAHVNEKMDYETSRIFEEYMNA